MLSFSYCRISGLPSSAANFQGRGTSLADFFRDHSRRIQLKKKKYIIFPLVLQNDLVELIGLRDLKNRYQCH